VEGESEVSAHSVLVHYSSNREKEESEGRKRAKKVVFGDGKNKL